MTTSTTDTGKRLSDVELARIRERDDRYGPHKGFIGETNCDRHALLSHIATLTVPPSQGEVERARAIYRACYEEVCRKDTKQFPSREHLFQLCEDAAIAAIQQALTEPAQGASVEAMREAAVQAVVSRLSHAALEWQENNAIRAETYRWAANHAEKAIRALPVSGDGGAKRDAVIEECARWYDDLGWELPLMNVSAEMKRALKSKHKGDGE